MFSKLSRAGVFVSSGNDHWYLDRAAWDRFQSRQRTRFVVTAAVIVLGVSGLFALWLVLAGLERLLVEFLRRNDPLALGLTLPQWQSVGMIVAGVVWLVVVRRRHGSLLLPREEAYPGTAAVAAA